MRLAVFLLLFGWAQSARSDTVSLDHHGRWVTTALLIETLNQEYVTTEKLKLQKQKLLDSQIAFLNRLAEKIRYKPTHRPAVVAVSSKSEQDAMAQLPHWESWSYLAHRKTKLRPLCRHTSRSLECRAFLSLHDSEIPSSSIIQTLYQLARDKPKQYGQPNIRAYHALLLLRQKNYPESLRVLFNMQQSDAKFKLIYNKIQRIFSLSHKAGGEVVLRQAL